MHKITKSTVNDLHLQSIVMRSINATISRRNSTIRWSGQLYTPRAEDHIINKLEINYEETGDLSVFEDRYSLIPYHNIEDYNFTVLSTRTYSTSPLMTARSVCVPIIQIEKERVNEMKN